jgi:dUTP pyrophosphatase
MDIGKNTIYFAKVRPGGIIPDKKEENAGYDLFPEFEADFIIIQPNEIKLIPSGIASAFHSDFVLIVKERSSTGSKGMSVRMGVIDSGYRGEIIVGINNTNSMPVIITKDKSFSDSNFIIHNYHKAIAQAILVPVPKMQVREVTYEDLMLFESERKTSFLGASDK